MGRACDADRAGKKQSVKPEPAGINGAQPNTIAIYGVAEWKAWVERLVSKMPVKARFVIDSALAEHWRFAEPTTRMPMPSAVTQRPRFEVVVCFHHVGAI
jgi:hypothetical protein